MKPTTLDEMMQEPDELPSRMKMLDPPQQDGEEFVDRIEGDTAVLMTGEGDERNVPVSDLPHGTKEGDTVRLDPPLYQAQPGETDEEYEGIINSLYAMPR